MSRAAFAIISDALLPWKYFWDRPLDEAAFGKSFRVIPRKKAGPARLGTQMCLAPSTAIAVTLVLHVGIEICKVH